MIGDIACALVVVGLIMRKSPAFFIVVMALLMMLGFCGCILEARQTAPSDAVLGVIETQGEADASRVVLYDDDLNEVAQLSLPYANVGNSFYSPLVYEGGLFSIAQGPSHTKDAHAVLRIDLDSLAAEAYTIEQPAMNDVAANDEYVFTCNTLNYATYLNRCDMGSGEVSDVVLEGVYVSKIVWHEGNLYAFGYSLDDHFATKTIYRYDENLALKEAIDFSSFDFDVYRTVAHEGRIYFCGTGLVGNGIGVLDTASSTVDFIRLDEIQPSSVAFAGGKLYVGHYNVVQGRDGSALSVIDLETGVVESRAFEHGAKQVVAAEGSLYVLDGRTIYRYDAESLELVVSGTIGQMPGRRSHISGLFALG